MLAQRIPGILPPLTRNESLETTRIYSAMGLLPDGVAAWTNGRCGRPPLGHRAGALVGGGTIPRPGEVSLAHHGILFLDELRVQPLRAGDAPPAARGGEVTVARVHRSIRFPAKFMLVAAMNPTPSGFASDNPRAKKYLAKLSGPCSTASTSTSRCRRCRTRNSPAARRAPTARRCGSRSRRHGGAGAVRRRDDERARMDSRQLKQHAELSDACLLLMRQAMDELGLSARRTTRSAASPTSRTLTASPRYKNFTSPRRCSTDSSTGGSDDAIPRPSPRGGALPVLLFVAAAGARSGSGRTSS